MAQKCLKRIKSDLWRAHKVKKKEKYIKRKKSIKK
jgi:hypothetical protein